MELRPLGFAPALLLGGCWQYLEPGMYHSVHGNFVPEEYSLYNQAPFFLLEEVPTYFRVAVLESSRDQVGLAFLLYVHGYMDYDFYDYTRLGEVGESPNFVLCERIQAQFVCKADEDGQAIFGRVNTHDGFTLFGSGSESAEGTVINDIMLSFVYEFELLQDISSGEDPSGRDIFTEGEWRQLETDFADWMER